MAWLSVTMRANQVIAGIALNILGAGTAVYVYRIIFGVQSLPPQVTPFAAFFTIRATAFDYGLMCQGKAAIDNHIKAYKANPNLSKKEQDTLRDMKIVQEFYARGFEFLKIDLYQSDAIKFQVVEGKLLPPFSVIEGMGGIAAEALAVAAHAETERGEKFLSKDDIRQKAKISQTVLDTMAELGLLGEAVEDDLVDTIFSDFCMGK